MLLFEPMSNLTDPRVLFAAERTLLAWNRTSLALIAFGFVLERSGLLLQLMAPQQADGALFSYSLLLGLAFILLGAACAAVSAWQYAAVLKTLTPAEFPPGYRPRWSLVVNVIVALLGVALVAVLYAHHG